MIEGNFDQNIESQSNDSPLQDDITEILISPEAENASEPNNDSLNDEDIVLEESSPDVGATAVASKSGIGLFRPSTGRWYLDYDSNGGANYQVNFGVSTDKPVAGDWDGDSKDEIGLYRPSTGRWYLDYDNNGGANYQVSFGRSTDKPVAGDWDGDGKDEIGLYRPSTGRWYLDYDNNGGANYQVSFGRSTDIPVAGDWDGKQWTIMVYLCGDNNLEDCAIDDFLEMAKVGSSGEVNIVVQLDRRSSYDSSYGDWTNTKRFYITKGMTPIAANAVQDLGEQNMGDPATLSSFINWAKTQYPANDYSLVLWNHGSGWRKSMRVVPWGDGSAASDESNVLRGICYDDTNGDYLTLQETGTVLAGSPVTQLGSDACLMQMIEVLHQHRLYSQTQVGSEELEPGDGWPYDTILADLVSNPKMTTSALGSSIVQRYIASYSASSSVTMSAVKCSSLPALVTATDNLAQALINVEPDRYDEIQQARTEACFFGDSDFIDLYDFARLVKLYVPESAVTSAAQSVMDAVTIAAYKEGHGSGHPNAHGISVYMPSTSVDLSAYMGTKFAIDTHWDEFLTKHYDSAFGFDEQFSGTSIPSKWVVAHGTWSVGGGSLYSGDKAAEFESIYYNKDFSDFDYEAKLMRKNVDYLANSIIIRGNPTLCSGYNQIWDQGYLFEYTRDGYYSVWKLSSCGGAALQSWTTSSYINTGDQWNTMKVSAVGSSLKFYINNNLVWSGTDTTYTSGKVGILYYAESNDGFYADSAKLTAPSTASDSAQEISSEQQQRNEAAMGSPIGNVGPQKA